MEVKCLKIEGWADALFAMKATRNPEIEYLGDDNPEPSTELKERMLSALHSPIRLVNIFFQIKLPNKTMGHITRHSIGVNWFVSTLRSDLTNNIDLEITRVTERNVFVRFNLEALIKFCRVRTCGVAEKEAREFANMLIDAYLRTEFKHTSFTPFFSADCGRCTEVFSDCGNRRASQQAVREKLMRDH